MLAGSAPSDGVDQLVRPHARRRRVEYSPGIDPISTPPPSRRHEARQLKGDQAHTNRIVRPRRHRVRLNHRHQQRVEVDASVAVGKGVGEGESAQAGGEGVEQASGGDAGASPGAQGWRKARQLLRPAGDAEADVIACLDYRQRVDGEGEPILAHTAAVGGDRVGEQGAVIRPD